MNCLGPCTLRNFQRRGSGIRALGLEFESCSKGPFAEIFLGFCRSTRTNRHRSFSTTIQSLGPNLWGERAGGYSSGTIGFGVKAYVVCSTHGQRHEKKLLSKVLLPITITKEPVVWESVLNLERHAMRSVPRITLSGVLGLRFKVLGVLVPPK